MNGLLVGNDNNPVIVTSNLLWTNERLIFSDNASLIINKTAPIINVPFVSNSHFAQIINTSNGGTGNNSYSNNSILFYSSNNNQFQTSSNLFWCNIDNSLRVIGNIYGIGSNITALNPSNFISNVPVNRGGTGSNYFNPGEILYGNGINNLLTSSALSWNNITNTLNVSNINIYNNLLVNGSNISNNIDVLKVINILSLSNGGIGTSNINKGEFLFGVDNSRLGSSSNIKWDEVNSTLRVQSNIFASNIYSCNFVGNGFNLSNLDMSKLVGILPLSQGGLGFSNIEKFNFVYAYDSNKLSGVSNIKWDKSLNSLIVEGAINIGECNFTGNGFNIKNLNAANLIGLLPVNQGGTGVQSFEVGKIILGGPTSLLASTNLNWQEALSKLGIGKAPSATLDVAGDIKCDRLQVGQTIITAESGISTVINGSAITQGVVRTSYGGTGSSNLVANQLIIGNDTNPVLQTSNLIWNRDTISLGIGTFAPLKTLDVNGDINFNGALFNNYVQVPSITSIKQNPQNPNVIYTDKQFFIGYSNSDNYKFKVDGNVYVAGYITGLSDVRYKTNISNITEPIDKIEQLQGVYYNLLHEEKRSIGLIAQEVEKIIPEVVYTNTDNTKSIAYGNMIAVIVESIKELSMRIKKLEEKL